MAIYVGMLDNVPGIAGHLMAASIMSAPAALVITRVSALSSAVALVIPDRVTLNSSAEPASAAFENSMLLTFAFVFTS